MRYQTHRLRSGAIVQAGLNVTTRDYFDRIIPRLAPYRAVVLQTMVEDSIDRLTSRRRAKVLCDVIMVSSQITLQRVQVVQRLGVNSGQPWIPRPSTRRISTNGAVVLQRRSRQGSPEPGDPPTPFDDLDGDAVLMDFIEGDLDYPIISGSMEHERTLRTIVEGEGWDESNGGSERGAVHKNERYVRWGGTEFRVNAAGDVLFDTVGATSDIINEAITAVGGQFRIRVKSQRRFTVEMDGTDVLEVWKDGAQVRIDLGEGAAQRLVLGDDQDGALSTLADDLKAWAILVKSGIVAGGGTLDNSVFDAALAAFKTANAAALSDLAKTKKTK